MLNPIKTVGQTLAVLFSLVLIAPIAGAQTFDGNVDFRTRIHVQSISKGVVAKVNAKVGDRLAAGAVLIELDSTRQRARVRVAQNRVAKMEIAVAEADSEFARQQEMFDRGSLSLLLYEESENKLKSAQLDLGIARANLSKANYRLSLAQLVAPIDAIVIARNVHTGMHVHPEFLLAPLMTLASDGDYIVRISVPIDLWRQLSEKEAVTVMVDGQIYTAAVEMPMLDPQPIFQEDLTYPLHLRFSDNRLILPGTAATVHLE